MVCVLEQGWNKTLQGCGPSGTEFDTPALRSCGLYRHEHAAAIVSLCKTASAHEVFHLGQGHRTAYTVCVQWILSKMVLGWRIGDELLTKVVFLFFVAYKKYSRSFVKIRFNPRCQMDYFTISLLRLWMLIVLITLLATGWSESCQNALQIS